MSFKYKIGVFIVFVSLQMSFAQTFILNDTIFSPNLRAFTIDSSITRFTLQCACDSFELEDVTFENKIKFYRNQKKITKKECVLFYSKIINRH